MQEILILICTIYRHFLIPQLTDVCVLLQGAIRVEHPNEVKVCFEIALHMWHPSVCVVYCRSHRPLQQRQQKVLGGVRGFRRFRLIGLLVSTTSHKVRETHLSALNQYFDGLALIQG